jgi:hypothetical protein
MEVSGQFHAPEALLPGKEILVPIRLEAGWAQSRFGRGGEERNSQPPLGTEPYNSSSSSNNNNNNNNSNNNNNCTNIVFHLKTEILKCTQYSFTCCIDLKMLSTTNFKIIIIIIIIIIRALIAQSV